MWNSREYVALYFLLSFQYIKYIQLEKPFTYNIIQSTNKEAQVVYYTVTGAHH